MSAKHQTARICKRFPQKDNSSYILETIKNPEQLELSRICLFHSFFNKDLSINNEIAVIRTSAQSAENPIP